MTVRFICHIPWLNTPVNIAYIITTNNVQPFRYYIHINYICKIYLCCGKLQYNIQVLNIYSLINKTPIDAVFLTEAITVVLCNICELCDCTQIPHMIDDQYDWLYVFDS